VIFLKQSLISFGGKIVKYLRCIFLLLWVLHSQVSAESKNYHSLYEQPGIAERFSSNMLVEDSAREEKNKWFYRLAQEKSSSIQIVHVGEQGGATNIEYTYVAVADSTAFIRLAAKVSELNVALIKITVPKDGVFGTAEISISRKSNPLFKNLK